ncbi:MAG: hypothetical protein LUQ59_11910, partial [Methanothrix sp.]|nr:hypothetical protein [Methanothrix sp.]
CNFYNHKDILHYIKLSEKLNVETHFFQYDNVDYDCCVTVYVDDEIYSKYYSDFSEIEENFDDDQYEIKDIEHWLKAKKYNIL